MGITRNCLYAYRSKRSLVAKKKRCCIVRRFPYKNFKNSKPKYQIDLTSVIEDMMYNLNTSSMHLKLYIKRLMYECVGDTRNEIAVFYAMSVNLYKETSEAYYGLMNYKKTIVDIDIKDMQDKYDGILDLCGITSNEIYDGLFDENDDGYETPPREGEEDEPTPASLCEEMEEDEETTSEEDELYNSAIESMNQHLSIK
jgi:hypothetical protein